MKDFTAAYGVVDSAGMRASLNALAAALEAQAESGLPAPKLHGSSVWVAWCVFNHSPNSGGDLKNRGFAPFARR